MKKIASMLFVLLLVLSAFFAQPAAVRAASSEMQDGFGITITTDRDKYSTKEDIKVSIDIENTNSYSIDNISIMSCVPEGLNTENGNLSVNGINLGAGETYSASYVIKHKEFTETDNNFGIILWVALIAVAVIAVVVILVVKAKKKSRVISMILCVALVLSMLPMGVAAEESEMVTFPLDKTITVGRKEYTITASVVVPQESLSATCVVNFDVDGGTAVASQIINKGTSATEPTTEKEGFLFVGWYADGEWSELFDFSKPISTSCTVYARWVNITDTTDADGDCLTDAIEEFYGTNSLLPDTDEDGLSDYIEIVVINYDPMNKDTDNDSVLDGQEDYDKDGIDNKTEVDVGTSPAMADTDGDNLSDKVEIDTYKTNPIVADTDNDGANDGWEIENGFDPLVYNDSFNVEIKAAETIEENGVVASVQIDIDGDRASSLKVESVTEEDEPLLSEHVPGYLGTAYDFSIDGEITSAIISFEYDTSLGAVSEDFQPRIYYFNEETGRLEELENQTVIDGKISVEVSHFSKYILLNKIAFDEAWENEIMPPADGESDYYAELDVIFVIDYSLSMEENDPYQLFKDVSEAFVNKLRDGKDKAGAVKFIRKATLVSELTTDKESVISAINGIRYDNGYGTYSGTDGSTGIKMALDLMGTSDSKHQYIVFVTDGEDNGFAYEYDSLVEEAIASNVVIYAIGMGSASESVLRQISSQTGGKYYHATTGMSIDDLLNLSDAFEDIESETIDLEFAASEDNITDYYSDLIRDGILLLSNGSDQFAGIDFKTNKDYDGDGLLNGEELRIVRSGNVIYLEMLSDPTKKDTDGDGIADNDDKKNKMKWDVCYRDLALLANAVYENYPAGTDLAEKNCKLTVDGYGVAGSTSELVGWKVIECVYNPITGFEASAYAKDNNIVIATRGSEAKNIADFLQDWVLADVIGFTMGLNAQLPAMETFISCVVARYGNYYDNIYVTGHSLGGYLALMASSQLVKHGLGNKIKGVVTFNALGMNTSAGIGTVLDIDDHINLQHIRSAIKNYRTNGDVVSIIGYTPGDDVCIKQAEVLGGWGLLKAHSLVSFVERFSNEQRKPAYKLAKYHGLNDEK